MEFAPPARSCTVTKWPEFKERSQSNQPGENKILFLTSLIKSGLGNHEYFLLTSLAKGYGFTLANNKLTKLPEIGKVDPGSPAAAAGLKPKDIIIEINGHNVLEESHNQRVSFFLFT